MLATAKLSAGLLTGTIPLERALDALLKLAGAAADAGGIARSVSEARSMSSITHREERLRCDRQR
ncbi:MAG TPA: hypothetical protein VGO80_16295 [Solirubrobacteraceae bacterium]|jgi:hypothetical protein|nr:hypothetical protein [Solirubrobacteraceae bacterium]